MPPAASLAFRAAMRSASAFSDASKVGLPTPALGWTAWGEASREAARGGAAGRAAVGVDCSGGGAGCVVGAAAVGAGAGLDRDAICCRAHQASPKPTGIVTGHRKKTMTARPSRIEKIREASSMSIGSRKPEKADLRHQM